MTPQPSRPHPIPSHHIISSISCTCTVPVQQACGSNSTVQHGIHPPTKPGIVAVSWLSTQSPQVLLSLHPYGVLQRIMAVIHTNASFVKHTHSSSSLRLSLCLAISPYLLSCFCHASPVSHINHITPAHIHTHIHTYVHAHHITFPIPVPRAVVLASFMMPACDSPCTYCIRPRATPSCRIALQALGHSLLTTNRQRIDVAKTIPGPCKTKMFQTPFSSCNWARSLKQSHLTNRPEISKPHPINGKSTLPCSLFSSGRSVTSSSHPGNVTARSHGPLTLSYLHAASLLLGKPPSLSTPLKRKGKKKGHAASGK